MTQENQAVTEFLAAQCAGIFSATETDGLALLFAEYSARHLFDARSESNLLRILGAQFSPRTLLRDALHYPEIAELLTAIAANSNFLTDVLVRYPGYVYYLFPGIEHKTVTSAGLRAEAEMLTAQANTPEAAAAAVTRLKLREITRIGAGDKLGLYPLEQVTAELSTVATATGGALFERMIRFAAEALEATGALPRYFVMSLGKLGGRELNYSSDIDLILVFEDNRTLAGGREAFEVFSKAVQLFTAAGGRNTGDGLFYRIDFRLRPDGKHSPLARTIADFLRYYESRGEDWERQMLLKADFFCGERALFADCMNYLQRFIFPASFSTHPLEQIRRLRRIVSNRVTGELNIKQSPGGLRDIEFPLQALQLLNGGVKPALRSGNTLTALQLLQNVGLITAAEAEILQRAYRFFRGIEHYLQLMDDRQTHTLQPTGEVTEKCARQFGFSSGEELVTALRREMAAVLQTARAITGEEVVSGLNGVEGAEQTGAKRAIAYLREGRTIFDNRGFDSESIAAFTELEPLLSEHLNKRGGGGILLERFAALTALARFPSQFYKSCLSPAYLEAMITVCAKAPRLLEACTQSPELAALLIDGNPAAEYAGGGNAEPAKVLRFRAGFRFAAGGMQAAECGIALRDALLAQFATVCGTLRRRNKIPFFLAGLGSFGSGDMVPDSDIDIIIIHRQGKSGADFQETAAALYAAISNAAAPFTIDSRLRPEGKKAQLSWDVDAAGHYLASRARLWEFQAFTRLHFIFGNHSLFADFCTTLANHSTRFTETVLRKEMAAMRSRLHAEHGTQSPIKYAAGGITDIEFIAQHFVLQSPEQFLRLRGKPVGAVLGDLTAEFSEAAELSAAYRILKNQLFELYLQAGSHRQAPHINTSAEPYITTAKLFNQYFKA